MRVTPANIQDVDERIRAVFAAQARRWGAPLINHLVYARVPAIFAAVRAMWAGLDAAGRIPGDVQALVNRRVAALNGCVFWQDINAAVGSELGVSDEKLEAVSDYANSHLFTARERLALRYADAMTLTGDDVSDELFAALRTQFSEEEIIVLTEVIAWENASSKFNRALRVPSQGLWRRKSATPVAADE